MTNEPAQKQFEITEKKDSTGAYHAHTTTVAGEDNSKRVVVANGTSGTASQSCHWLARAPKNSSHDSADVRTSDPLDVR